MKIFTNSEIRQIDQYTIEHEGVTPMELIDRVARAVTDEITARWRTSKPVVIFAGPGNNGADALAVGALLAECGYKVHAYLFNIGGNKLSTECVVCRDRYMECPGVGITEIIDTFMMPELQRNLLIIDGLFGSGLRDPLKGGFSYLVQRINESRATVVSIDIPSGLAGDWNPALISRDVIHATLTLAVQHPRLAFFIADNAELVGEWKLLDIGLSQKAAAEIKAQFYLVEAPDVYRALKRRPLFSSKADYGSALIYAGSYGMMGAAVMATRGALRSGVGKVTVETPKCGYPIIQSTVPEALYSANQGEMYIDRMRPAHQYSAVAAGPGIGTNDPTLRALEELLLSSKSPLILDADALNCIAIKPSMLNSLPMLSIITPHAGEFDRLFGQHTSMESRLRKACDVARHYHILIVLKGRYTSIIRPDGKIYFNSSGCPAMATPGSGDVLTGMLAAFLAQGYSPEIATLLAVYLHGLAGELAAEEHGDYGVTASDIADNIGRAIKAIMEPIR
ncbi:MAG: NAD(P)H-hydrate dehydratase [Bacteroidales bacterium]|nr:NAD(P)H-hydrate dehydratase [Bacteroidales bacterium]MBD5229872.1 NAD(P)H-hydrate dehydratase [Bacteroidales bacterium]MBD5246838.1 NAD(P)H-hydrate dehydratase [Barnesiella sp.]MBD5258589.1 NAD(P)H-hydrate dehydratase [Barnesiella sp.]